MARAGMPAMPRTCWPEPRLEAGPGAPVEDWRIVSFPWRRVRRPCVVFYACIQHPPSPGPWLARCSWSNRRLYGAVSTVTRALRGATSPHDVKSGRFRGPFMRLTGVWLPGRSVGVRSYGIVQDRWKTVLREHTDSISSRPLSGRGDRRGGGPLDGRHVGEGL